MLFGPTPTWDNDTQVLTERNFQKWLVVYNKSMPFKEVFMNFRWISLVILSTLVLIGCSQEKDVEPMEPLAPTSQKIPSTPLSNSPTQVDDPAMDLSTPLPDDLETLIEKAKADLAQQLSIAESTTKLVTAIKATWPDSSLGCPQPGIAYSQVLTDGFLIRLEADGNVYEYHTDANEQVFFCENPEFPVIPVTPGEIDDGQPWVPVN